MMAVMYRGAGARWQPNYMVLEHPNCCHRDFFFFLQKANVSVDAGCEEPWCLGEVWSEEEDGSDSINILFTNISNMAVACFP